MNEPTQEQKKEFWEWYGWKQKINYNDPELNEEQPPTIDLNNLFEYAVPKAVRILKGDDHEFFGWKRLLDEWLSLLELGKDSSLALFWVLDKVREASE